VSAQPQPLPEPAHPRRSELRSWVQAVRPRTLTASIVPVLIGSAVANLEGAFVPGVLLACIAAALLLQISANLINDAVDFLTGIDTQMRLGPERVTQAGLLPAARVLWAAGLATALALCTGSYLVWLGGIPILVIGISAALAAAAYSTGPFPLASHGLGELAAFVFFGAIAVTGTAYLHSGSWSLLALVSSLPVAALISNLMLVNNLRDIESDQATGKRTLAVRLGARATRALYLALLALAYASPLLLWALEPARLAFFLPWLSVPLALAVAREVQRASESEAFGRALIGTARLHAVYGTLLAMALLL